LTGNLWLLATRQGLSVEDRADLIRMASKSPTGTPSGSGVSGFARVAYAGAGRFSDAMTVAQRALELLGKENRRTRTT